MIFWFDYNERLIDGYRIKGLKVHTHTHTHTHTAPHTHTHTFLPWDAGIIRDKTMEDKLMYIPKDYTQNYPFCKLNLLVEKFGHLV